MKLKKLLPFIGIAIFIYLLFKLNLSNVFNEISNVKINFLLIAVIFAFIGILTETLKWFVVARYQKIKIPFLESVKINLISSFYGFITPAKIGNVIRANYLKKYSNNNLGKGIGNFVLDKILDLLSLVLLAGIFLFIFQEIIPEYLPWLLMAILILITSFLIIMNEKVGKLIFGGMVKIIGWMIPKKWKDRAKESFYSFHEDKPKKDILFCSFLSI